MVKLGKSNPVASVLVISQKYKIITKSSDINHPRYGYINLDSNKTIAIAVYIYLLLHIFTLLLTERLAPSILNEQTVLMVYRCKSLAEGGPLQ